MGEIEGRLLDFLHIQCVYRFPLGLVLGMSVPFHHRPGHVTGQCHDRLIPSLRCPSLDTDVCRRSCRRHSTPANFRHAPHATFQLPMGFSGLRFHMATIPCLYPSSPSSPYRSEGNTEWQGNGFPKPCPTGRVRTMRRDLAESPNLHRPLFCTAPAERKCFGRSACRHCMVRNSETRRPVFSRATRAG